MRNNRQDDLTSFELLLDTMCNTFGGIVFIALLLTILSQALGNIYPQNMPDSPAPPYREKETVNVNDQLDALQGDYNGLQAAYGKTLKEIKGVQAKINIYEKEKNGLIADIDSEKKLRKRHLCLPRLHPIAKIPVFLALQNGKFYAISDVSTSDSFKRGYDVSDISIRESGRETVINPKPDKGQSIGDGAEKLGKLRQAIANINPKNEFLVFAVDKNSFAEFIYVKNIFINQGFDYNWSILEGTFSIVKSTESPHAL